MHVPLPMAVCAVATEFLPGSHQSINLLFEAAGIPGPPPDAPHHTKWKTWLFREANKPDADGLMMLGNLIGEFMDLQPADSNIQEWTTRRTRVETTLESYGFRYFRGGRVLPNGQSPPEISVVSPIISKPSSVNELLEQLINGLITAMWPLQNRRKGVPTLNFTKEADLQDLLHAMMRPWIKDIRPEEFCPSYAGRNARIDFILPAHRLALELKRVRDLSHGTEIGKELTIDIAHYRSHADCDHLWCVIFDPEFHLKNAPGLVSDLEGPNITKKGKLQVRVFIIPKRN